MANSATIFLLSEPVDAMSRYRWQQRPVLVFAASASDTSLPVQRQALASRRSDLAERDVVVVTVVGEAVTSELGPPPGLSAKALRTRYGVRDGEFRVLLVGKDGGVKLAAHAPLAADTLLRTIDAMPMRQDEMRRR